MYYIYERESMGKILNYKMMQEDHLFGCNVGIISKILRHFYASNIDHSDPPNSWGFEMRSELSKLYKKDTLSFIIDAKPKNQLVNNFFEILNVYGICEEEWTPMLLHLREIIAPVEYGKHTFSCDINKDESIFTFLYAMGTFKDGEIIGKWTSPSRSSTNSIFLYNNVIDFFLEKINHHRKI